MNDPLYNFLHPARRASRNLRLRAAIVAAGAHTADIAARLGVCESTLYRWLRWELTEEKHMTILSAIIDCAVENGRSYSDVMSLTCGVPWDDELEGGDSRPTMEGVSPTPPAQCGPITDPL